LLLTFMLEALLSKSQIMEIYLNHIEWGQGVFGVEAAAQHYFKKPSRYLTGYQSAQLAVMLPAPRKFEKNPQSAYLLSRANTIHARMGAVTAPRP
jgi:monofunctional biosynthetic peptidoglycan transglycosylase